MTDLLLPARLVWRLIRRILKMERWTERYSPSHPWTKRADRRYFEHYSRVLLPLVRGPNVLDLGCGEGWFTVRIAKHPGVRHVLALDRAWCWREPNYRITYEAAQLPEQLPKGSWDTVVATEFIEHITEAAFMELLDRLCASPCDHFIGSTPNRISPTRNPYHLREYTKTELETLLRRYFYSVRVWVDVLLFFECKARRFQIRVSSSDNGWPPVTPRP